MYTTPMVTIELEEYQQLKKIIEDLSKPAEGTELSETERQEATGLLLTRALTNPGLFKGFQGDLQLGKFKAIFGIITTIDQGQSPRVKFVRT